MRIALVPAMTGVKRHEDLQCYQLCDELQRMLEPILERPAFRRDFELWDQINRAVNSPCPNIAEGFSRFYPRDNARFVRTAKGSLSEFLVHLPRAVRKKLVSEEEAALATPLARRARGAVIGYLVYLENCPPRKPPSERPRKPP